IVLWSASAMIMTSIALAGWAVFGDRSTGGRASRNLAGQNPTMREVELQRSPVERLALPVTRQVGARLVRFTPIGWVERRNVMLARAGLSGRVTAEQVLGAKLVLPVVFGAVIGLQLIGDPRPRLMLFMLVCVVAGFLAPDILPRAKADRRAEAITLALPDLLDQVTISVEAGLGFESALARTSAGQTHALAQELLRMLQDVRLGATRSDALKALSDRSQVDDLKSVVLTLRQADSLGVPMAGTLRTVSNEMREKRRFRAEARAQRLSTLLIFPLGLCILPALFIVILGPTILSGVGR
ncbi:MAG: type II secretion system F family protein, partial [Acidimicrobiales bacterium]